MEDQQAESAGLTGDDPDDAVEVDAAADDDVAEDDTVAEDDDDVAADDDVAEDDAVAEGDAAPQDDDAVAEDDAAAEDDDADAEPEPGAATPPRRRRVGRWFGVAVGTAAALFVGSAAFAGTAVQPYLADRAMVATKVEIVRTATAAITALGNYTPDNITTLVDRAAPYVTGDFAADYRKFIDQVAGLYKQTQTTNETRITGAAVESLTGPEAVALVYTNTTSTKPQTRGIPSLRYYSHRVFLTRDQSQWRITRISTVTSVDLTAQL